MIEKAKLTDLSEIVAVIESARAFLKAQEIDQWQKSAYPAAADVRSDIENNVAYVLKVDGKVVAYAAVMTGFDPAYDLIHGAWRNDSHDYVTVHRMAVSTAFRGQALGQGFLTSVFETFSTYQDFRVDTHPDNQIMQHILTKLGFEKCGVVMFEGARWAYQKVLED
ncbi:GNAT family N-acetyltransferase [Lactococcus raffinolactis]|jgi:ribosomal protein S18 acetylase RimI-like enzyme|uniref:GNAT family N-acetyltransferase n=1 Tax=Pseudolactococcus raffinolactis TaxID=1366 RepID=A0AAE6YMT9_9LACT|nr:GNAT family N-acetyltransferase [Lactococcus raffinolactis]QIW59174.1 GNAT family N-acetyltransferase [Lactococcus raffinolactis]